MTYIEGLNAPRSTQRPAARGGVPVLPQQGAQPPDRETQGTTARATLGRIAVAKAVMARPEPADDEARRKASERAALEASAQKGRDDAKDRVDAIASQRGLRPSDISLCLSLGRVDAAIEVAARLSGVPTTAAVRAYQNGDIGKALSQLASVGVDSGTAAWLLRGMGRVMPGDFGMAEGATAAYAKAATLSTDQAARSIEVVRATRPQGPAEEPDAAAVEEGPEEEAVADDAPAYGRVDFRV